uniref:Esterase n=1 Tax=Peronospora matthiolae TaxID=2874970 RepID=A0AAV1U410_9STRA
MNRALEAIFPAFSSHGAGRTYFSYPEGSLTSNYVFRVVYNGSEPIEDGRVILFFAPRPSPEPRFRAFNLEFPRPLFAKDVENVQPGDSIVFESIEFSTPEALGFVPQDMNVFSDKLFVQALIQHDVNDPDANSCVGNTYSKPVEVRFGDDKAENATKLVVDQVVVETMDLTPTEWVEHVSMKSDLLSKYHNQDVYMMASIVFPKDYKTLKATRQFPTVYYIEGYGGTESYAKRAKDFLSSEMGQDWQAGRWPTPMLRITLGSRFKFGHTSFADTETNGPWGTALVKEFIPYIESLYPAVPSASGRFLHGHSSGAWATLWLQLQFPEFFGGTWSSAPDPVDFSHFQVVNIYEARNVYWDVSGHPYPTTRKNGVVVASIRDENLVERVRSRGNGGQWDTFAALFGPRGADGMPVPLYDKVSGDINHDVATHWQRFDACKFLQKSPDLLLTKLRGKVHVICGVEDTYYLDTACRSLQKLVGDATSNAQDGSAVPSYVAMVPGDHTGIRSRAHYKQVHSEIAAVYEQSNKA